MSADLEILAYLDLEDSEPSPAYERLIEWAAACRADGVILPPKRRQSSESIKAWVACAAQRQLRCYVASPAEAPTAEGVAGHYIEAPDHWSRAALANLSGSIVRVDRQIVEHYKNYEFAGAKFLYVDCDRDLSSWFAVCDVLRKTGRLPGYFDAHSGYDGALEQAVYAPLIVKRLVLNRSQDKSANADALRPYEFGTLVRLATRIRRQMAFRAGPLPVHERPVDRHPTMPGPGAADIAIVIRSKNEANWLGRTLEGIAQQQRQPREVILVDNESTDNTVAMARGFQGKLNMRIISISDRDFNFSRALNRGIEQTTASWVVSLSAHCVPVNEGWLGALEQEVLDDTQAPFLAGVYGRQEPVDGVTSDLDTRDLWMTFGPERRMQLHNPLFHNANSMIRRSLWAEPQGHFRFNETLQGVEDVDWAQRALQDGYAVAYTPHARVYHYHGIHHGRNEERVKRFVRVFELMQQRETAVR